MLVDGGGRIHKVRQGKSADAFVRELSFLQTMMIQQIIFLLFHQYHVIVLEGDFLPPNATMNWSLQRESLLNMLLGSRKTNYKSLMKDCVEVICQLCQLLQNDELSKYLEFQKSPESQLSKNCYTALSLALLVEVLKNTCVYMAKLLEMIMALDMSRKKAEIEGHTSRADSPRTPLVDIILDELAYSKDNVPHFLKDAIYVKQALILDEAKQIYKKVVTGEDPMEGLYMIDIIQRLGIEHYFAEEIEVALGKQHLILSSHLGDFINSHELCEVVLTFRLLRQGGHYINADLFDNLKCNKLREKYSEDVKDLIALYEASQLSIE